MRSAGKVTSVPVLTAVVVLADGGKELLALELCGSESGDAWTGFVDDLRTRGLRAPLLAVIDGNPGLRQALGRTWPATAVQRCCVHKLRNLERKAPKHALDELREDFHRIVYAASGDAGRTAYTAFERKWAKRCPGVVRSLQEGGAELLTFFTFPKAQWKTLRTTNVIERLNEEFRRRVKTQGSLPTEDAALILLFSRVASGQIKLRKIDGHTTRPSSASGCGQRPDITELCYRAPDATINRILEDRLPIFYIKRDTTSRGRTKGDNRHDHQSQRTGNGRGQPHGAGDAGGTPGEGFVEGELL